MMAHHVIFPRKQEHVVLMLNARKETMYLPENTVVGQVTNKVTAEVMENAPKGEISLRPRTQPPNRNSSRISRVAKPKQDMVHVKPKFKALDHDEIYGEDDPRAEDPDKTTIDDWKDIEIGDELKLNEKMAIRDLLQEYKDLWHWKGYGQAKCKPLVIETEGPPVARPPYRQGEEKQKETREKVKDLLEKGVISESDSAWSAPVILIPKRDGTTRFVIDYRALNKQTKLRNFPMPHMSDAIRRLRGMSYFSVFDARSGHWQLPLDKSTKHKTAFVTSDGLYEFNCLAFGLKNGPSEYSAFLSRVLGSMR